MLNWKSDSMVIALLKIRFKQLLRGLLELGVLRLVFVLGLLGFLCYALYMKAADKSVSHYISIGFLVLVLLIQLKREDKQFLKSQFFSHKTLLFYEYLVFSVPVFVFLLIHGQWFPLIILLLGLPLIVQLDLKPRRKSVNSKLQRLIPSDSIEWKAGARKHFFIIILIWVLTAATSFFVGSVPVCILILGLLAFGFYENNESLQILLSHELSPNKFLILKAKRLILLFSVLVLPLILLFFIFNFEHWYVVVIEYFAFCFIHIYAIVTKYAFYEPNSKSAAAQIFGGLGFIGGAMLIFLPGVWLLTIYFYIKSVDNLNYYLDDFN